MTGRERSGEGARREVGLALRADRRRRGQSQRAYAAARGLSRAALARAEVDAGGVRLESLLWLLRGTGYELVVVPADQARPPTAWEPTDLEATTRSGSRFPPHREVRESRDGPTWWWYHEVLGNRGDRGDWQRPGWTAEGFTPPPGTRYGRKPRPRDDDDGATWPY
ncbi:hypothetical protein [Ornithinimicrobium cerasi]|uniref:hypothetical protein n=1 Tax=Ornithinimicrobium cerasi TaxID=2248773 RepID=UPI00137B74CF|nr:hypothetical protein [Ornithinimicrobium cerasi]